MSGLMAVFEKELRDDFSSKRFFILLALVGLFGLSSTYIAGQSIREGVSSAGPQPFVFLRLFTASSGALPPFVAFLSFLGPLVGVALGFDAINAERAGGTLSRLLSQPIYRDAVINGKFLAGVSTIAVMLVSILLLAAGLGLRAMGVPPTLEEVLRLIAFLAVSLVYVAFWMGLAILFSILFKQTATSALASIAAWILLAILLPILAGAVAEALVPLGQNPAAEEALRQVEAQQWLGSLSPANLFQDATITILRPEVRTLGPVMVSRVVGMLPNPLPLGQSLFLVWPQLMGLLALTLLCFAISYVKFMREEIRSS